MELAEATIINFIAPIAAFLLLAFLLGSHFNVSQALACIVSVAGVVYVLQP